MRYIYTTTLLFFILFSGYSESNKDLSKVFFKRDAKQQFRILRNEVFARHGRVFKSEDLNLHFKKTSWYSPNPNYNDSLLNKNEKELVIKIQEYEKKLSNLKGDTLAHYKKEVKFRELPNFDSSLSYNVDYTGNGKKETHLNIFQKRGMEVFLHTIVLSNSDTIFNEKYRVDFAPKYFYEDTEVYYNWSIMIRENGKSSSRKPGALGSYYKTFMPKLMAQDIVKLTGIEENKAINQAKAYLENFNGYVMYICDGESGGKSWIWYEPLKCFITYYVA